MPMTVDVVEFHRSTIAPVVSWIERLSQREHAEGWINLGPALDDDEFAALPPRRGLGSWFSARGPVVPMATWTPAVAGSRPRQAQIGLAHGTGPDALERLAAAGVELPSEWRKVQDHAKHGVVASLSTDPSPSAVVEWLLAALTVLSPIVPADDVWIAEVYHSAGGLIRRTRSRPIRWLIGPSSPPRATWPERAG
ncbi:MAG: hypothetical protein R2695_02310 [Acidimicrobiales bacterium]